ncbi:protein phosphatase 2C domain-containing protein [Rossellomorea aquimaris]|uniref:PP2C family protein-serine/threonine phosphatase n=1 Tax=Rossellomorea aquimaris TaxID=189382 RepID=UPI001CD2D570|nr:protein phosphatase 2C domain-containing protein [Rossellomorea aquimaris]MCA1055185.1 protein phosphatase 2C domain-containing protein [Rossellomorea aquimaris]
MEVLTAMYTDIGIKKSTNQDAMCIKVAETSVGKVVMAVICDGMGGLSKGEVASASVINAFSSWFNNELPRELGKEDYSNIQSHWERIIRDQNQRISSYGKKVNIKLGTTLTVLLLIDKSFMLIGHVGDSRVYRINESLTILTDDQTVVGREIKRGALTPEQAEKDPRRNVLLQCIGASKLVEPDFIEGKPVPGEVYMLCSDGFRHMITGQEIYKSFSPTMINEEADMKEKAKELVELNKRRQETDNISVALIKMT